MAGEEPPFLPVGTEVSAKYRGAFCEAKVKKIIRNVKCKIRVTETGTPMVVQDEELRGHIIKASHMAEVKMQETGLYVPCMVNKITDQSIYTVVFDDGDENTLRRSQLCLKGEKHFVKSDTLDDLPLTHPEHFGTPVMRSARSAKSKRMMHNPSSDSESDIDSSDEDIAQSRTRSQREKRQNLIGHVVCVEIEDRKRTMWVPALVVQPTSDVTELTSPDQILVKSFRDSKFFPVFRKDIKEFRRELAMKNEDKVLKVSFEKALLYYDTHELPQTWSKDDLLGSEDEDMEDEEESSDEEPSEEKDRFVAQLYKFMDDRGTPMNKAPQINSRDLNLYKLFRLVQDMGGCNKVTNQMKWHVVYSKMNLPPTSMASNLIKTAYKKFLHAFEDFDRKLGCTMGTITRPRVRHSSGRSILSFRERERESTPKSPKGSKKSGDNKDDDENRSIKDISDRSDIESVKSDLLKSRLEVAAESSDSDDSLAFSRPSTRETVKQSHEEQHTGMRDEAEGSGRPVREEVKRVRDGALALKVAKEEERKAKVEKQAEKEEDSSKKTRISERGRKKDIEDQKEEKRTPSKRLVKEDSSPEPAEEKAESLDGGDDEGLYNAEYSSGTRLRIKYGRGKNIKVYEAKVVEVKKDGLGFKYKVHYAGWNIRYDEWLKKDRIVGAVDELGSAKKLKNPKPPPPPPPPIPPPKIPKGPMPPSSLAKKAPPPPRMTPPLPKEKTEKEKDPVSKPKPPPTPVTATPSTPNSKAPRPTRSTSVETKLAIGLPPKRRTTRTSGLGDSETTSRVSSESDMSDEESTDEEVAERVTRSKADTDTKPPEIKEKVTPIKAPSDTERPAAAVVESPQPILKVKDISHDIKEDVKKQKQPTVEIKIADALPVTTVEKPFIPLKTESPAKEESKPEKKIDERIYDFEDSSSQDSFKSGLPLSRQLCSDVRAVVDRGRCRRKDTKRVRGNSTDSSASNDSIAKPSVIVPKIESSGVEVADPAQAKPSKEMPRSCKKNDIKTETGRVPEVDRKKPGAKAVKDSKPESSTDTEPCKLKTPNKSEKPRGKRKSGQLTDTATPSIDTDEKVKKVRRKKNQKDVSDTKTVCSKSSPAKPLVDEMLEADSSSHSESQSPDKRQSDFTPHPEPSWSPTYAPAPTLTQPVGLELKNEHDEIDEPAPQLSPITAVVLKEEPPKEEVKSEVTYMKQGPSCSNDLIFQNTPPDTPDESSSEDRSRAGTPTALPDIDEKSGDEVGGQEGLVLESSSDAPTIGGDSPTTCDTSTMSNGSGGSSGNAPGSESEDLMTSLKRTKAVEEEVEMEEKPAPKRRRRKPTKSVEKTFKKPSKQSMSDSDEAVESSLIKSPELSTSCRSVMSHMSPVSTITRIPKYNFLNLEDGKFMDGEDRIKFLVDKMQDIRKLYMQLKGDVAGIDRRRKRQRRKLHEAQVAAAAAAVAAVVSRGEAEMS